MLTCASFSLNPHNRSRRCVIDYLTDFKFLRSEVTPQCSHKSWAAERELNLKLLVSDPAVVSGCGRAYCAHPRALEIWGTESPGPSPVSDPAKRSRDGRAVLWLMWTPVDVGSMWSPDLKSLGKMGVSKIRNDGENEKRLAEVNGKLQKRSWWKCCLQLAEFREGIPTSQPLSKREWPLLEKVGKRIT